MKRRSVYPVPGPAGGKLIRQVVKAMRTRPATSDTSHIHIALSGGPDSLALARVVVKYGRNIADPQRLRILHVDHEWRPQSANDARHVRALAKEWGIPFKLVKSKGQARPQKPGQSWEDAAREFRKSIFRKLTARGDLVLTAHTADDLAETVLWRLLTGTSATHGGGILQNDAGIFRPLLRVRKAELLKFLEEESLKPLEDQTNSDPRFLRARMRQELFPLLEAVFPRAVEHLVNLGLEAQSRDWKSKRVPNAAAKSSAPIAQALRALGVPARASHWRTLDRVLGAGENKIVQFPQGWRLTGRGETWRLERVKSPKS